MNSLTKLLESLNPNLKVAPKNVFIKTNRGSTTYNALNNKVTSAAKYLREQNIQANEIVPILSDHSIDFIVSVLALWTLKAVSVPLNARLSQTELEEQIKFLRARFLLQLGTDKQINLPNALKLKLDFDSHIHNSDFDSKIDLNQEAIILFTSGSAGKPKAVELTFSNLINSAVIGNKFLNQTTNDHWLASLPFYHIGGFSILFRALIFGAKIIMPENLKVHSIIQSMNQHKPTLFSLVSSQLSEIQKSNIHPFDELRYILLGGGFIDINLMKEAINKGWNVCKVYGSTETSSFVTVLDIAEFKKKPESVGKPIPPNEIFILDEFGSELPPNKEGEIVVRSPAVMKGYFNNDELTKQKLRDGFYFTGDIGYLDDDGYLHVVNRRSDLIVTGGENVNPLEVEVGILKFPNVKEVCVFGVDDEKWGHKIAAAIVTRTNQKFEIEELKDFLRDKIASFKIPKVIYFVDELPKTELGKVKREEVRTMFL